MSALALWLTLCVPGYAAEAGAAPRFELRHTTVRTVPPGATSRFALSARLQNAAPAVDSDARFKASAQLKVTTASCGTDAAIFSNGFEGP